MRATVLESKPVIADHTGTSFAELGLPVLALNDGLASAWGHACLPQFAGRRVATLALGTGVGCGLAEAGRLVMGPQGQTLKLNDLRVDGDQTFEDLLAGSGLSSNPDRDQIESVGKVANRAVETLQAVCLPDVIVLCGGLGLAPWLELSIFREEMASMAGRAGKSAVSWVWPAVERSPFGENAGLYGAAALALFPPVDLARAFVGQG
jgi:N-acetylmannosamine-6-phosphate 2-epimerase/N-acetylmannosamine kinase